ncbi:hypothetical protein YC2023_045212 [Brassica napus]
MKAPARLMPLGSLTKVSFAFPAVPVCQGASYPFLNGLMDQISSQDFTRGLLHLDELLGKLNKPHRSWDEEVIPLSNQVIPVSQFGNSTASSSFQSNQDESLCEKLDLDT